MNKNLTRYNSIKRIVDDAIRYSDELSEDEKNLLRKENIIDFFIGSLSVLVPEEAWNTALEIALSCFEKHDKLEINYKFPED
jgi:hypothetical protein